MQHLAQPVLRYACHRLSGSPVFATTATCAHRKAVASKGKASADPVLDGAIVGEHWSECAGCVGPWRISDGQAMQVRAVKPRRAWRRGREPFPVQKKCALCGKVTTRPRSRFCNECIAFKRSSRRTQVEGSLSMNPTGRNVCSDLVTEMDDATYRLGLKEGIEK